MTAAVIVGATMAEPSWPVIRVTSVDDVAALARRILDPARRTPIVVVAHTRRDARLDPDRIAAGLAGCAEVAEIETGPLTEALAERMPAGTAVFGDAARTYPVGAEWRRKPELAPMRLRRVKTDPRRLEATVLADAREAAEAAASTGSRAGASSPRPTPATLRGGRGPTAGMPGPLGAPSTTGTQVPVTPGPVTPGTGRQPGRPSPVGMPATPGPLGAPTHPSAPAPPSTSGLTGAPTTPGTPAPPTTPGASAALAKSATPTSASGAGTPTSGSGAGTPTSGSRPGTPAPPPARPAAGDPAGPAQPPRARRLDRPQPWHARTDSDGHSLAEHLLTPGRTHPVLVVSTPSEDADPLIDADDLHTRLERVADVVVLHNGPASWAFAEAMPQMTQVYGGAGRVYPVDLRWQAKPSRAKLRFCWPRDDPAKIADLLEDDAYAAAHLAGLLVTRSTAATLPAAGKVKGFAGRHHALLWLDRGGNALLLVDELVPDTDPARVLRIGQRIGGRIETGAAVPHFIPDPITEDRHARVRTAYRPGDTVLARISSVSALEAHGLLLPGVAVRVGAAEGDVDLRNLVAVDEVCTVTLHEEHDGVWTGDLAGADSPTVPGASLLPDGPAWLAVEDLRTATAEEEADAEAGDEEPSLLDGRPTLPGALPDELDGALAGTAGTGPTTPAQGADPLASSAASHALIHPAPGAGAHPTPGTAIPASPGIGAGTTTLPTAGPGGSAPTGSAASPGSVPGRTAGPTLPTASTPSGTRTGSAAGAATPSPANIALHSRILALQAQLDDVATRLAGAEREIAKQSAAAARAREEANRWRRSARSLKAQHESYRERTEGTTLFADPAEQLRYEVTQAWLRRIPEPDRTDWPLAPYTLGPRFLDTLAQLQGISRDKVLEVVVEVLTDRAKDVAGRELHPLRIAEVGEQRVRADGARAWRCALQVSTPSARRLHFWRCPDGSIELDAVGVHDAGM